MPNSNYQYNKDFDPALLAGHTARLFKTDGVVDIRVLAVGTLPNRRWDVGAVTSGGSTLNQDPTMLDMPVGELAQFRAVIRDNFELEMSHPGQAVRQWQSKANNWRLGPVDWEHDPRVSDFMWQASEFWVYEDETPRFDFYAFTSAQDVQGHVDFYGYRYAFQAMDPTEPYYEEPKASIYVNSWPSGGSR